MRLLPILLLASSLLSQLPPGGGLPGGSAQNGAPTEGSPAAQRWVLAKQALAAGDLPTAREHLLQALQFHSHSPDLLLDFLLACGEDQALAALWCERFVRAASDAQGKLQLSPEQRKRLPKSKAVSSELDQAQKLHAKRTAAMLATAKFAARLKPNGPDRVEQALLLRWAMELLVALGDGAPELLNEASRVVGDAPARFLPDINQVLSGLSKLCAQMQTGSAGQAGPTAAAVAAARTILGLSRQQHMPEVYGPFADATALADAEQKAQQTMQASQQARAQQQAFRIEELAAMQPDEVLAFTRAHGDWSAPGIALSTTGRYRVETICGHETLLGVARTVELHHQRLVSHYGVDPFLSRQGVVRIVPDHTDMETDGSPHWWAGGFQGGDVTTIRFAWGNIPGLGRTLTHELTHRFDGVLRPFLGGWYGEGHANWTAGHYAKMTDETFVEDYLDFGTVASVRGMGYGSEARLRELLLGQQKDYRDNYPVGYTLYAFLRGYRAKGPQPYRRALASFEQNARAGSKDPFAYFTRTFCDGQDGRAGSWAEFVVAWQTFLNDVSEWNAGRRKDREWLGDFRGLGEGDPAPLVMDEPTWSWSKQRVEPFFGQGHAAQAAALLTAHGDHASALAACLWSLDIDGWQPGTVQALQRLLAASKTPGASNAFSALAKRRFPNAEWRSVGSDKLLPSLDNFRQALAARSEVLAAQGASVLAGLLDAERCALAAHCGGEVPAVQTAPPPHLPDALGTFGYTETALVGFDKQRTPGLWYEAPDGDLHVGRNKPREGTGTLDRGSARHDAFAHSVAWYGPGAYKFSGRVHFTTSFADGAIVLGHQRRDRNVRLAFTARNYDRPETRDAPHGTVTFTLSAAWERDAHLPTADRAAQVDLHDGQTWFDFVITVQGMRVRVAINGETVCGYALPDGSPIEGHVGVAMTTGAVRVQQPLVQCLAPQSYAPAQLDLAHPCTCSLDDLLLLPVQGAPRAAHGTLLLWLPGGTSTTPIDNLSRALLEAGKLLAETRDHPQAWCLAVPETLPAATRQLVQSQCEAARGQPIPTLEHRVNEPLLGHYPFVLFLDADGVLRAAAEIGEVSLHSRVAKWARMFRGQPRTKLPPR